jgi:serine/threonine protein phosphatase PrpC
VRPCPKCGTAYGEDDTFCEIDGTRLTSASPSDTTQLAPASRTAVTEVPVGGCPACGAVAANEGDGYCKSCGHRLADSAARVPLVAIGATLGGYVVEGARDVDELVVRGPEGRSLVVLGTHAALELEARALERCAFFGASRVACRLPQVYELGQDPRRGAFLRMSIPPNDAVTLGDVAPAWPLERVFATVESWLALAVYMQDARIAWKPNARDLWATMTEVGFARARAVGPLASAELDAADLLERLGGVFLPHPAVTGPARLVRALASPPLATPRKPKSIGAMKKELEAARAEALRVSLRPHSYGPSDIGAAIDAGLRRDHNEDAVATAAGESNGERWAVLVVCDGVSSSQQAGQASEVAARTACDALAHFAKSGDIGFEGGGHAVTSAIHAAHIAICAQKTEQSVAGKTDPPGTTIVVALIHRRRLTVGWVGDSRAYWVTPSGGELLTHDHSWVNETVDRGEMTEEEALKQPLAHALTRCLGPLEVGDRLDLVEPGIKMRDLPGAGHVVLCSDGLWNYYPSGDQIAALVREAHVTGQEPLG